MEFEHLRIAQSSINIGDPHICSDSINRNSLVNALYEPLITRVGPGVFYPCLAQNWAVQPDKITWLFRMRDGVSFHNGVTLTAEDVVASLNRIVDPSLGGAYGTQGVYASYVGGALFQAPSDDTLKIVTTEPIADLLDLLSEMPIGPMDDLDRLPNEYIGTGPYIMGSKRRGEIVLERYRDHWSKKAYSEDVTFIEISDSKTRSDMVLEREIDIAALIDVSNTISHEESQRTLVHSLQSSLCIIFMMNCFEGPCVDERVRQALNYGLDVDTIIGKVKSGAATKLNGYITPYHFGYNPNLSPYPFSPNRAESLIAEAGYSNGLELVMDIPTSMPDEAPQLANIMKEHYSNIGIDVNIKSYIDRPAYAEMVKEKRINDLCCFDSSPLSTFRVLREKINSRRKGPWWEGYSNPEVDRLIETAQMTFNDDQRKKIYMEIFKLIRDDAPWVFLYRPTYFWAIVNSLEKWSPFFNGVLRLAE